MSKIQKNLYIDSSTNQLRTLSNEDDVFLSTTIDENFDSDVGIYNIDDFLACVNMLDNPKITCYEKYISIKDQKNDDEFIYICASKSILKTPPEKDPVFPTEAHSYQLQVTDNDLQKIRRAGAVLGIDEVVFSFKDLKCPKIIVKNPKTDTTHSFSLSIDTDKYTYTNNGDEGKDFVFNISKLKMMSGESYNVTISESSISKWENVDKQTFDLHYYIAVNA